jgi:hypothetical protein
VAALVARRCARRPRGGAGRARSRERVVERRSRRARASGCPGCVEVDGGHGRIASRWRSGIACRSERSSSARLRRGRRHPLPARRDVLAAMPPSTSGSRWPSGP